MTNRIFETFERVGPLRKCEKRKRFLRSGFLRNCFIYSDKISRMSISGLYFMKPGTIIGTMEEWSWIVSGANGNEIHEIFEHASKGTIWLLIMLSTNKRIRVPWKTEFQIFLRQSTYWDRCRAKTSLSGSFKIPSLSWFPLLTVSAFLAYTSTLDCTPEARTSKSSKQNVSGPLTS